MLARPRPYHDVSTPVTGTPSLAPLLTDAEVHRRERENIQRAIARAGGKIYGRGGARRTSRAQADHPGLPHESPWDPSTAVVVARVFPYRC
jgi:hypothetical protein